MKKLSIGMATFDDYDGVFFSIQSIRMYHQLPDIKYEFIVLDNNPSSSQGLATKQFIESIGQIYVPYTDVQSSFNKYKTIDYATGDIFLGIDSHVLISPDGIKKLVEYFEKNPESNNLIQGPLLYDDYVSVSTHFKPEWSGHMYGTWATDKEKYDLGLPFEIEMQGMGLYAFQRKYWKGINQHFKGFGAEEGYIQGKFKQWGGKTLCMPSLKWNHRFGRPEGPKYNLNLEDRIFNYFLGCLDIHGDLLHPFMSSIHDYFNTVISKESLDVILENVITSYV